MTTTLRPLAWLKEALNAERARFSEPVAPGWKQIREAEFLPREDRT